MSEIHVLYPLCQMTPTRAQVELVTVGDSSLQEMFKHFQCTGGQRHCTTGMGTEWVISWGNFLFRFKDVIYMPTFTLLDYAGQWILEYLQGCVMT